MKLRYAVTEHGYGGYTAGCKCAICRAAKAAYQRGVRARAQRIASARSETVGTSCAGWRLGVIRYVAPGVTHGTRYAYDERGCRCFDCTDCARTWKASPNGATRKESA